MADGTCSCCRGPDAGGADVLPMARATATALSRSTGRWWRRPGGRRLQRQPHPGGTSTDRLHPQRTHLRHLTRHTPPTRPVRSGDDSRRTLLAVLEFPAARQGVPHDVRSLLSRPPAGVPRTGPSHRLGCGGGRCRPVRAGPGCRPPPEPPTVTRSPSTSSASRSAPYPKPDPAKAARPTGWQVPGVRAAPRNRPAMPLRMGVTPWPAATASAARCLSPPRPLPPSAPPVPSR